MLYIHKLSDLNRKSAEIESVPFVRGIRQSAAFPFSQPKIEECFASTLASESDILLIERSIQLLEPTIAKLNELLSKNNQLYEAVNVYRTIQSLRALATHLMNNLIYAKEVLAFQQEFIGNAVSLLNSIPAANTVEEKLRINATLSAYFERVLRNKEFSFTHQDIVYEAQTILIHDLVECFRNGYVFHVTLEEEIRKAAFADIKGRIPPDKLQEAVEIGKDIGLVKEGVDQAYSLNMRMISWAIVFLSFIKCATSR